MTNQIHKFTIAGLGEAPFSYIEMVEVPGQTCDYCSTAIRYCFHIRSADGHRHIVGSDCIAKVGDKGLMNIAKNEINDRKRAVRNARNEEIREANLQAQRDRNGGLTDYELQVQEDQNRQAAEELARQPIIEILAPLAEMIKDGKGGFCDSIGSDLERGFIPVGRGWDLVCSILAKKEGRSGSKKFNVEYDRIQNILKAAEKLDVAQ